MDARGIPTHACPQCGCTEFLIRATFQDCEIAGYYVNGTCFECGSNVTVPTPLDRAEGRA
jgi:hypothetical protein